MKKTRPYVLCVALLSLALFSGCGSSIESELECPAGFASDLITGKRSCIPDPGPDNKVEGLPGDCTVDGEITVADAQCIALCIEGTAPQSADCQFRSDCDCDGDVTASDAQCAAYRALDLPVVDHCDGEPKAFEVVFALEATPEAIGRLNFDVDYGAAGSMNDFDVRCYLSDSTSVGSAIEEPSSNQIDVGIRWDGGVHAPADMVRCTGFMAHQLPEASDFLIRNLNVKTLDRRTIPSDQVVIRSRIEREAKPFDVVFALTAAPEVMGPMGFDVDYSDLDGVDDQNVVCETSRATFGNLTHDRKSDTISAFLSTDDLGVLPPIDMVRCTGFMARSLPDPNDFVVTVVEAANLDLFPVPLDQVSITPRIERPPKPFDLIFELTAIPEPTGRMDFNIDYSSIEDVDDRYLQCWLVIPGRIGNAIPNYASKQIAVQLSSDGGAEAPLDLVRCTGIAAPTIPKASDFGIEITIAMETELRYPLPFDQITITPRVLPQ